MIGRLCTVVLACLLAAPALAEGETLRRFQAVLSAHVAHHDLPGATAAFILSGGPRGTAAAGLADREAGRPMHPDTPMLAASIGKSFVAMTLLALEDRGQLSRSDPVAAYLGDRPWFARLPNHDTMTLDHLLHHSAGLPDHVHAPQFADRMRADAPAPDVEDTIALILDAEPLFPAGSGWSYSDTGYLLLGLVIETASGTPYEALVAQLFLRPLDLRATDVSDRRDLPGLAVGYTYTGNAFGLPLRLSDLEGRLAWDPAVEWTGGGLLSTSADLATWGDALFGGRAMGAAYLDRLLEAAVPRGDGAAYGAGVAIEPDTPRGPVLGHGGWVPGYVSSLRHYADHGLTIAFQINSDAMLGQSDNTIIPALEAALADAILAGVENQ